MAELRNYMSNYQSDTEGQIDIEKAVAALKEKKRGFEQARKEEVGKQEEILNGIKGKLLFLEEERAELEEKMEILRKLLLQYNDGRRKTFFCTAVNLLELEDARAVMEQIEAGTGPEQGLKERAAAAADCFRTMADSRGISLKLRKKTKKA